MKVKKVNWYDEQLHKFYDTKKDNDGFIYGLYGYEWGHYNRCSMV
jgi:hypothetical protein